MLPWVTLIVIACSVYYSIDASLAVNFGNDVGLQGVMHVYGRYMGQLRPVYTEYHLRCGVRHTVQPAEQERGLPVLSFKQDAAKRIRFSRRQLATQQNVPRQLGHGRDFGPVCVQ